MHQLTINMIVLKTLTIIKYFTMKRKTLLIVYFVLFICVPGGSRSALTKQAVHEIMSVEDCNLPKEENEAVPIQHAERIVKLHNKRTFEMNITVVKKTLPLLLSTMRIYKFVNNKKTVDYTVSDLSCKNPIIMKLWKKLRFKSDRNCCVLPAHLRLPAAHEEWGYDQSEHELTSMEDCNLPKEVYEAVPIQHAVRIVNVNNKRTVEMNLTVVKKTLPLLVTVRVYKLIKDKKVPDHMVSNLSCKNPVMSMLWRQLRFKFDRNCCMLPGVMVINHLNMDDFFHNPRKFATLPAGTHIYDFQLHTKRGVMLCLSSRID